MDEVVERAKKSAAMSDAFAVGRAQGILFDDPRARYAAAAIDLAHEHHSATAAMKRTRHYASAVVLHRPLIEAALTAMWACHICPPEHAEQYRIGERQIKSSTMWTQCAKLDGIGPSIKQMQTAVRGGSVYDGFVHGDGRQLMRRSVLGDWAPTFSTSENLFGLILADTILAGLGELAGPLYGVSWEGSDFQAYRDALLLEARATGIVTETTKPVMQPPIPWIGDRELHLLISSKS